MNWLTVRDCAKQLRTSPDQVLAEIKSGRLRARIRQRESGRSMYRIEESDFVAYIATHWQASAAPAA